MSEAQKGRSQQCFIARTSNPPPWSFHDYKGILIRNIKGLFRQPLILLDLFILSLV